MVTAAKITADLLANDAQFVDGFNRAATSVGRFAQQVQKDLTQSTRQIDKLVASITGIKGALGSIATIGGIVYFNRQALQAADAVDKLAQRLGLTTDEIQRYEYAAKLSGASNEDLQTSFNYLNKLIAEGKVPYHNLSEAIADIAKRMQSASNGAQQAQLAFDTMGKTGIALIPFFKQGPAALKALGDEAERLGAVLPAETIARAVQFKDQMDALGVVITKNFQAGVLKEFTSDSGKLRDIYSDPSFVEGVKTLGEAFGIVAKSAIAIVSAYQQAVTIIGAAGALAVEGHDKDMQQAVLDEMHSKLAGKNLTTKVGVAVTGGDFTGSLSPRLDKQVPPQSQLQKYIDSLNKETDALGLSERALFQEQSVIKGINSARTDYEQHLRKSPDLTDEETQSIQDAAGAFYDLKEAQREAEQFNQEFKSGFADAVASVTDGTATIGDAIRNLIKDFAALIEKELILKPLMDSIFGAKGSGGFLGGGIGGISGLFGLVGGSNPELPTGFFPDFPSFDVGTSFVPHDMTANIHRGEGVLTPQENRAYQSGKSGTNYYINANGASKSDIQQLKALVMSLAGPGRVEDRIKNFSQRGGNL